MTREAQCFLTFGFPREAVVSKCSGKKKEPHTQPNANPSALLGRERLVNLWVFLSCCPIFSPTHLKEAWVGGDFSLWQICRADRL